MNTTYTSLFRITTLHTYYASNICEGLHYNASPTTQTIIDKYGLIVRKNTNGFELYTTTNQPIEEYLNYIKQVTEEKAFEFSGTTIDQNFYNYTAEIPLTNIGILSYEKKQDTATAMPIELTKTFIPKSDTKNAIHLKIEYDDIIRLRKTNTSIEFQIQLNARKTQWRYYIINNSNQNFNELAIESNTDEIQFSNEGETTLQNGQRALLFSSGTHKIPLKNTAENKFNLINTKTTIAGNRKETVFKGLPIPNTMNLQILEDDTIASLMYVYI
jgi:hypothetical protein